MTSEWTICITALTTEEALDIAARIADAEEPDCDDLLLTEGARVCDVLRCEVLHQAEVIERRTAELSTATGEIARLRAGLEVAQTSLAAATSGRRVTACDEIERLQRELASAQQTICEWREQTARTNNEIAELLPDDPAVWGPGDVAYALVQARGKLAEAHAIIEGRTVPPTDAEIAAHTAAGGAWLFGGGYYSLSLVGDALGVYDQPNNEVLCHGNAREWLADRARWPDPWIPLDAIGRPCAWPVVEARHG